MGIQNFKIAFSLATVYEQAIWGKCFSEKINRLNPFKPYELAYHYQKNEPFSILGVWVVFFFFSPKFNGTFCKQSVNTALCRV